MYQICVSGAARGESVEEGQELALNVGRAIAKAGHMLITGATIGLPNYAAIGCKEAGGISVGISPAATKVEHVKKYRLPTESYDVILYTGLHYVGRDTLMVASSDAVVSIGGRLGTLHEFTVAMEMGKPMGFLQGAGGVSSEIHHVMEAAQPLPEDSAVIFETEPDRLIAKLTRLLDKANAEHRAVYKAKKKRGTSKPLKKSTTYE